MSSHEPSQESIAALFTRTEVELAEIVGQVLPDNGAGDHHAPVIFSCFEAVEIASALCSKAAIENLDKESQLMQALYEKVHRAMLTKTTTPYPPETINELVYERMNCQNLVDHLKLLLTESQTGRFWMNKIFLSSPTTLGRIQLLKVCMPQFDEETEACIENLLTHNTLHGMERKMLMERIDRSYMSIHHGLDTSLSNLQKAIQVRITAHQKQGFSRIDLLSVVLAQTEYVIKDADMWRRVLYFNVAQDQARLEKLRPFNEANKADASRVKELTKKLEDMEAEVEEACELYRQDVILITKASEDKDIKINDLEKKIKILESNEVTNRQNSDLTNTFHDPETRCWDALAAADFDDLSECSGVTMADMEIIMKENTILKKILKFRAERIASQKAQLVVCEETIATLQQTSDLKEDAKLGAIQAWARSQEELSDKNVMIDQYKNKIVEMEKTTQEMGATSMKNSQELAGIKEQVAANEAAHKLVKGENNSLKAENLLLAQRLRAAEQKFPNFLAVKKMILNTFSNIKSTIFATLQLFMNLLFTALKYILCFVPFILAFVPGALLLLLCYMAFGELSLVFRSALGLGLFVLGIAVVRTSGYPV